MSPTDPAPPRQEILDTIEEQVKDLCHIHDHITRIIANLEIKDRWFSDYDDPERAKFNRDGMIKTFLYMHARGFNEAETARRLSGAAFIYVKFDFPIPPSKQAINYNKRRRFSLQERKTLKDAGELIHDQCVEHDLVKTDDSVEPALEPEDIAGTDLEEEHIMDAVERASTLGFSGFTADRASNAKYALECYLERQAYLNMSNAAATTPRRRFARLSDREEVPHGSSHNRTMKKIADPDSQLTFDEFVDCGRIPDWERIRDETLDAFHTGVERILDEIQSDEHGETGIREPVNAALDIVTWNFWPSPFKKRVDADPGEQPVTYTTSSGRTRTKYLKDEYPVMASGFKESHERGYKFATLTIVAENTPIVLAIEPVRDVRAWEDTGGVHRTSRADIVDRLLEQAQRHVDINKVFADREFDTHEVRHVIDKRELYYVIGKRKQATADKENLEEVEEDPMIDVRVEYASLTVDGDTHDLSIMYVPKDAAIENEEDADDGDEYAIFTTNYRVEPDRAQALTGQYRDRWTIENQYKSIRKHFLPTSASKDYRVRFLYFTIGVLMHNVWRLTNFFLRDEVDVNLGEKPPLRAGEIVELVAFCLFDPGG
ncbi:transposase [Halapricum hydrolyticum]|uniref:Transposase n=1 Tax=Halapricum hydrolyticum TaxID=2979991 RepID=A0AAE3IAP9_9EURY|nr:transposase [Halapricum hydrolyticum]MCU4717925.1 transposase [Halapricum hydrolyticum]MCU4727090.1 transposase [Halapricum hydrolyticum]